jgi:pimeloyl-ACP methyl ester carboxylesterase
VGSELAAARQQAFSCALAPKAYVPPNDAGRARTAVPVLLTVGNADPQDPPSNIASAPTDFPNSVTLVVPGQGHTVAYLGCVPSIVDAFLASGRVRGLDTSCVANGGAAPPPFRLP